MSRMTQIRSKKSDSIYEKLKADIQRGKFLPGQRLVEDALAKEYGSSRNTIRLTLTRLENDGIVKRTSNGVIVSLIDLKEAVEILEVREVLEGFLARKAATRISEESLQRLEATLMEMKTALENKEYVKYSQLNERFHSIIYEASGNTTAQLLLSSLKLKMIRYQFRTVMIPGRADVSWNEHFRIFQALKNHDENEAELWAKAHVKNVRELIQNNKELLDLVAT
ncbi:Transcriptional regulator NanR [Metallosphaera sp. J1]|uniref:GntR family transcriptional regulator n=1 Tax=Metallosphaera javensis (ex Hofmann et al. 2022) TaxID=99938 RepID=UPI001EDCBBA2|nr:GntR family transcriptional regulator [Metallosphaera javensis (ex Hofmann et al. 2022)]MCG3109447.1 Transcriptional regulator NanR [Metallosphaera javensis (ex Hofmann et al. 2022)]